MPRIKAKIGTRKSEAWGKKPHSPLLPSTQPPVPQGDQWLVSILGAADFAAVVSRPQKTHKQTSTFYIYPPTPGPPSTTPLPPASLSLLQGGPRGGCQEPGPPWPLAVSRSCWDHVTAAVSAEDSTAMRPQPSAGAGPKQNMDTGPGNTHGFLRGNRWGKKSKS